MANPVLVDLTAGAWEKVATNVTGGSVKRIDKRPSMYLETYRSTGGTAPTSQNEGVPCFQLSDAEIISANAGIDVYIMAVGNDGRVRVDLP